MSAARLTAGLAALGLDLDAAAQEKLLAYQALLLKWNRTYNLTALRDPAKVLSYHLLDSLALLPFVGDGDLLDVGSGGGMPGIPVAIARPDLAVTLVDSNSKKVAFLTQAVIELGLPNVTARCARVEELERPGGYPQITSRAFAELADFIALTRKLIAPGGRWLAMKGVYPVEEIERLDAARLGVEVAAVHPLAVPEVEGERHVVIVVPEGAAASA